VGGRTGFGLCAEGGGLVGSFLCQEDGETNRRWEGLPPLCFLAEANERLIWVYEGEAERGAVRGCLGYGEEVKTGCWERGPFIGLLLAEVGERERLPWMEICREGRRKMGGLWFRTSGPFKKRVAAALVFGFKGRGAGGLSLFFAKGGGLCFCGILSGLFSQSQRRGAALFWFQRVAAQRRWFFLGLGFLFCFPLKFSPPLPPPKFSSPGVSL
jgi:hypothetical protein